MFGDIIKIGAKIVALGTGIGLILGIFTGVSIPGIDFSSIRAYMNLAYSIGVHYIPFFSSLWAMGVFLITLKVSIYGIRLALIGVRWILKVNE